MPAYDLASCVMRAAANKLAGTAKANLAEAGDREEW